MVRRILPQLLPDFQVVHLCGKGKLDTSLLDTPGYRQYEYISEELPDLFAMADIVISRAGANAICLFACLFLGYLFPFAADFLFKIYVAGKLAGILLHKIKNCGSCGIFAHIIKV